MTADISQVAHLEAQLEVARTEFRTEHHRRQELEEELESTKRELRIAQDSNAWLRQKLREKNG